MLLFAKLFNNLNMELIFVIEKLSNTIKLE
jgi:hypothetical protein